MNSEDRLNLVDEIKELEEIILDMCARIDDTLEDKKVKALTPARQNWLTRIIHARNCKRRDLKALKKRLAGG
jgi:hypothetical protein